MATMKNYKQKKLKNIGNEIFIVVVNSNVMYQQRI